MANAEPGEQAALIADHLRRMTEIADGNTASDGCHSIGEIAFRTLDELDKGKSERRLPTGFTELDNVLSGGFRTGTLSIIAARPSVGKTALMTQIAANIAKKKIPVLVLTLEMTEQEIFKRVYHQQTNFSWPPAKIATGSETVQEIFGWQMTVTEKSATIETIETLAARYRRKDEKERIEVVFIDYVGLIRPAKNQEKMAVFERLEEIAGRLKELAKREKIAVILLSQRNRESETKFKASLSDLRGSGGLEQAADVVLALVRNEESKPENVTLSILKNRDGMTGEIPFYYNGPRFRFQEIVTPPEASVKTSATPAEGDDHANKWAELSTGNEDEF